jgi:hypothetical protein
VIETTVVGLVVRFLAARATTSVRAAIAGGEVERALVSALDVGAMRAAEELAVHKPSLAADELAAAFQEQIRTAEVRTAPEREDAGIGELLHAALVEAFAPWRSEPMYEAVTTEAHFGIDVTTAVESLVAHTLRRLRSAASGNLDGLASEIRHDELLMSIRAALRNDHSREPIRPELSGATVRLAHFALDTDRCAFVAHTYDPSKPLWPSDDTGAVTYHPGGDITQYGRRWRSRTELDQYAAGLRATHNHRAFSGPTDAVVLEPEESPDDASDRSALPVFYVVVANHSHTQAILERVGVQVAYSEPLLGIPESRALRSLVTYEVPVPPVPGRHMRPAIPAIRVAPEDAAAFHIRLGFPQSFATLARVVLDFEDQEVRSPPISLAF